MPSPQQSSIARYAALAALVVTFVVIMVVVATSGGGGDSGSSTSQSGAQKQGSSKNQSQRKVYVVKPGDCCLSQIAQKTGIDISVLEQLNPKIDPQAIHSGDTVKLR